MGGESGDVVVAELAAVESDSMCCVSVSDKLDWSSMFFRWTPIKKVEFVISQLLALTEYYTQSTVLQYMVVMGGLALTTILITCLLVNTCLDYTHTRSMEEGTMFFVDKHHVVQ